MLEKTPNYPPLYMFGIDPYCQLYAKFSATERFKVGLRIGWKLQFKYMVFGIKHIFSHVTQHFSLLTSS